MTEYGIGDELCACRLLCKCGEGACGLVIQPDGITFIMVHENAWDPGLLQ